MEFHTRGGGFGESLMSELSADELWLMYWADLIVMFSDSRYWSARRFEVVREDPWNLYPPPNAVILG